MKHPQISQCLTLTLASIAILGCATHQSSLKTEAGSEEIYVIDEAELFNDIYGVVSEVFPKNPVFDIDGPIRGFYVLRRFGPDHYTSMVRIFPASGYSETGIVEGYYIEVTGEGAYFDGPKKDRQTYDQIMNQLGQNAARVIVRNAQRGEYKLERDRWKLKEESGSTRTHTEDVKERLMKLEDVYNSGLITKEEYDSKREEILSDL